VLFQPFDSGVLSLGSRIVMSPMTRWFSPGGVPREDVAGYYRRRAEADVGLIVTEGTWIPHPGAGNDDRVPRFYGEDALAGWRHVVEEVHSVGGKIVPQLWHIGLYLRADLPQVRDGGAGVYNDEMIGPSGIVGGIGKIHAQRGRIAAPAEVERLVDAYAASARAAYDLGFDGVALHGGHGYLIDQFFWQATNERADKYGGSVRERARFAAEVIAEIRRRTAPDFPIILRFSQWKLQDYGARIAETPHELAELLEPLVDAGVDVLDASQRRFWEPVFAGSDLNLAGWARKLTGKPSITVGSVGLSGEFIGSLTGEVSNPANLDALLERMERKEFDLVAVGRSLLVDPRWAAKIKAGAFDELLPYTPQAMKTLS
jgi:2,4-dienoyl-CoA reductase-like NADH-dependent reductase (Old Yellow Enzyme family)